MTQLPSHHDDPLGEARQHLLQALAVVSTLSEATARWLAARAQHRVQDATAQVVDQVAGTARRAVADHDRAAYDADRAFGDLLGQADLGETARIWRSAAARAAADGNPQAMQAMARAEARLAQVHPDLMHAYEQWQRAGHNTADAMRAAARTVWEAEARARGRGPGRPHPGASPQQLGAARWAIEGTHRVGDLDAATRNEVMTLATGVSAESLYLLQQRWRNSGRIPPAEPGDLLAAYARDVWQDTALPRVIADVWNAVGLTADARRRAALADAEQAQASAAGGVPDDRATPVDEHAQAVTAAGVWIEAAERDRAVSSQQQRMAQTFPPLTGIPPELTTRRPANVRTLSRTQVRTP